MTERTDRPLTLAQLVQEVPSATLDGDGAIEVSGVQHDSRRVEPGDLFVARKGTTVDGTKLVADARARGAVAILCKRGDVTTAELPIIHVRDAMEGLAYAAAAVYGHPSFGMEVAGITGTNGKTTTTHLVRSAVDAAVGDATPKCGLIGTVGWHYRDLHIDAEHTTPEADDLARVMLSMRKRGASHLAMEVSSIALALGRVRAVRFHVAAFTNFTQDHLDFHGTMQAYADAKAILFTELAPGTAVLCVDHELGRSLAMRVRGPIVRVSSRPGAQADIVPRALTLSAGGIDCTLSTPAGEKHLVSPLVGAHNVENLVVALGIVHAHELDLDRAIAALATERGAPGRLERVGSGDIAVFVDYAHTPDALARVLDAVRAVCDKGRILCVFGCGGDRDKQKRGPMGDAVARRADVAILTNDNPRTEDPAAIAEPIERAIVAAGMAPLAGDRGYVVELDRARAIEMAITSARPGDCVLIAGKGHEDYQIIGTEKRHFDDREQAQRALEKRSG